MDAPEIEFDEDVVLIDIYLREKRRRDFVTSRHCHSLILVVFATK
jgi:hypothetical protein